MLKHKLLRKNGFMGIQLKDKMNEKYRRNNVLKCEKPFLNTNLLEGEVNMNNHQHLVEVVVGRILDKYNVNVSKDLSLTDQAKVKSTVVDIQTEVNKFLQNIDMDTVGKPMKTSFDSSNLEKSLLRKKLTDSANSPEKEDSYEVNNGMSADSNDFYERPAVITRKHNPNSFVNRRRF